MAKDTIPLPVDSPLSKSYLRDFKGWSCAYPPGLSEPSSLRTCHNVYIDIDGSARVRPGLRAALDAPLQEASEIVGAPEQFYDENGKRSLLVAYRDTIQKDIAFTVYSYDPSKRQFVWNYDAHTAFAGVRFPKDTRYVKFLQVDNKVIALNDTGSPAKIFYVGGTQSVSEPQGIPAFQNKPWGDYRVTVRMPSQSWISGPQTTFPATAGGRGVDALVHNETRYNIYHNGYFITFENEWGETPPTGLSVGKTQRRQSAWQAHDTDLSKSEDQLVVIVPKDLWEYAQSRGAKYWNLYFAQWSSQDSVPPEAVLLARTEIQGKTHASHGWFAHTPMLRPLEGSSILPNVTDEYNSSIPPKASNGLVVGDRIVFVGDPTNFARIQWTSNKQGQYLNLSPTKGGGYKTLTSGNLYFPASVVLWQNPSSVDTITILNYGINGLGNAYYMNPNSQVTNQSQAEFVVGFEETAATSGTVSPHGNQVLGNSLYHPTENNLVKSTASNYNISHKPMADSISNVWRGVPTEDKRILRSEQMDGVLYYAVRSPVGWINTPPGRNNQIWLCDTNQSGIWSAWDVESQAIFQLEIGGTLYMAVAQDNMIYVLDPEQSYDDRLRDNNDFQGSFTEEPIEWYLETNTQGANRAHDAYATLKQMEVMFGNFIGSCEYGILGVDHLGRDIVLKKEYISPVKSRTPLNRMDQEDKIVANHVMKEWRFYWKSIKKKPGHGTLGYVCYRYVPASVNIGYQYGSVETFEYGDRISRYNNGVPQPIADTRIP